MKVSGKIALLTVATACLTICKASAQQLHDSNRQTGSTTSVTINGGNNSASSHGSRETPPPPPSEKKKWAVQVTQGEKWYQLSVKLVM